MQNQSLKNAKESCEKILRQLQLENKKNDFSYNLSGGEQRRLQLAIALAGKASVLILDEPTTGLDPENRRHLWDILLVIIIRNIKLFSHLDSFFSFKILQLLFIPQFLFK